MDVKEFVNELNRMMDSKGRTDGICNGVGCSNCEFDKSKGCVLYNRDDFESLYEAVNIVETWSAEHPKETNKEVFLKVFPNAQLYKKGLPTVCAYHLGIVPNCDGYTSCDECWNSEYKGALKD